MLVNLDFEFLAHCFEYDYADFLVSLGIASIIILLLSIECYDRLQPLFGLARIATFLYTYVSVIYLFSFSVHAHSSVKHFDM